MRLSSPPQAAGAITEINVTPLVDVCLVLVIIFMVLTPFAMQAGIDVAGSKVGAARGEAAVSENVSVVLKDNGALQVNGRPVSWEALPGAIRQALAHSRDGLVSVNASPKADVGQVVDILDASKQSGAKRLALLQPR